MNTTNPTATKELLASMAAEAAELKRALGGCVTDTVAGWLASQYCTAAHEKLAGSDGAPRWEILRAFVQDWAALRHGDHTAERLRIERERLKLARREYQDIRRSDEAKALAVWLEDAKQFHEVIELYKVAFAAYKKAQAAKQVNTQTKHPS
jgi:hypothetical protein